MADNSLASVQVVVRIRPLVHHEIDSNQQCIIEAVPGQPQVVIRDNSDRAFTFNHVFDASHSQEFVFNNAILNNIKNLFKGYNLTILAYGQTGSGKTHTMGTSFTGQGDEMGIIQRAILNIFEHIESDTQNDYEVFVSYMELYQEILYDLLADKDRDQCVVEIREDSRGGIHLPGLTETTVLTSADTYKCLQSGGLKRSTGATAMNATSSRSHAIFTITVRKVSTEDNKDNFTAKFNLVDLAGSERSKRTQATGERFKEGVKINKGLLALGNVISALGEENHSFISYRDSKLTRMLQDSLGGNSITLMIACVSPAAYNLEETISTLRYADRAKKIKNKPIVNQDPSTAEISRLKQRIRELESRVTDSGSETDDRKEIMRLKEENERLSNKNQQLLHHLQLALDENTNTIERTLITENATDKLKDLIVDLQEDWKDITSKLPNVDQDEYDRFTKRIQTLLDEQDNVQHEVINYDVMAGTDSKPDMVPESMTDQSAEIIEDIAKNTESNAMRRFALQKKIQNLARELAIKEFTVKEQLASNLALDTNKLLQEDLKGMQENEAKIQALEKEKDELLSQLKHMQTTNSSKQLAEKRRQKVQELEIQISDLLKKVREQDRMIKMREKDVLKIKSLNREILSMKQMKVKLVKEMRAESDKFRQWKISRERDIIKLRDQGRKQQNKIVQMQSIHTKQQNVLKRKIEEVAAVNKRLKDSLALSKKVSQERRGGQSGKVEKIHQWIDQEIESLCNTVEAERHLELLKEEKAMNLRQKQELMNLSQDYESSDEVRSKILKIDEIVEFLSIQITDMQQKINEMNQEIRTQMRLETVQSMVEAKHALKYLFDIVSQLQKKEMVSKMNYSDDLERITAEHNENVEQLNDEYVKQKEDLVNENAELKKQIASMFKQLQVNSPRLSQFRLSGVQLQDSRSRRQSNIFGADDNFGTPTKPLLHRPKKDIFEEVAEVEESPADMSIDDTYKDPDWEATPIISRIALSRKPRQTINLTANGTYNADPNETFIRIKRSSDGSTKCSCTTNCGTKRCSCKKVGNTCSATCKCVDTECANRNSSNTTARLSETDDKENFGSLNATYVASAVKDDSEIEEKKRKVSD